MTFLYNSLTRKNIIQAVYYSHYSFCVDVEFFLEDEDFFHDIKNIDLFSSVMQKVFQLSDVYEKIFNFLHFEFDLRSPISLSIFKAFIAELLLNQFDYKILFKEYLVLLDLFCSYEAAEIKLAMQKCLDLNLIEYYANELK